MHIEIEKIKEFYDEIENVWPLDDPWHQYSKSQIEKYIINLKYGKSSYILNAGSGGNNYGLLHRMLHVDIAENKIKHCDQYLVSSIEKTNLPDATFTDVICVGSVINYCDAILAISEIHRVLKSKGTLLLEFESSWGYEHRKSSSYKRDADILSLKYNGVSNKQWIFSYQYISRILKQQGFVILDEYRFHYLSGISYSNHQDEKKAIKFVKFDSLCKKIPFVRKHSNNVILYCKKV